MVPAFPAAGAAAAAVAEEERSERPVTMEGELVASTTVIGDTTMTNPKIRTAPVRRGFFQFLLGLASNLGLGFFYSLLLDSRKGGGG